MTLAEESLRERVEALADDGHLRAFAHAYLHRHHDPDAEPERVLAEVRGAYALMAGRKRDPAAVRAFNPTADGDGYEAVGSVVETATDDLPFLVDSVTAELEARDLVIRRVMHPIVGTERDQEGEVCAVCDPRDSARRESIMHFELDRRLDGAQLADVERRLHEVLRDVRSVVSDFPAMTQKIGRMIELARAAAGPHGFDEVNETIAFLRWLLDGTFTFLGYREYVVRDGVLRVVDASGLGLLGDCDQSSVAQGKRLEELQPATRTFIESGALLTVAKTNRVSPVRRHARMDYISVRWQREGATGECRLIGLFTRKAYTSPAADTPLLGHKLRRILDAEALIEGSHDHRAAIAIFGSFYKDELFAAPWEDLRAMLVVLLAMQADEVRVLGRRTADGRTASLVVALPRRRYSAPLGDRISKLLAARYGEDATIESHLVIDDQFTHARLHFALHAPRGELPDPSLEVLEADVGLLSRSWEDAVESVLRERHGTMRAHELAAVWCDRFPDFYKAATEPTLAAGDVERLDELERADEDLVVGLQHAEGRSGPRTRLTLYKAGGKVELSEILPILEMLGLQVHDERPARLLGGDGQTFVQNLGVRGPDGEPLDLAELGDRLAATIVAVRRGHTDADWLSKLVVVAGLTWQQVHLLRAYRVYRQRAGARFGLRYDGEAFAAQPHIAAKLVRLFELRHDPAASGDADALREEILEDLDAVASLDQDRILRDQLTLVDATLRTNAFKPDRDATAIKLHSADVIGIPSPKPYVEVFVHSVAMEGIHLRGGAIARGGLRWSDRLDFRTEVYGLMRAQMTKNAVIVPTGAKGGFYLKQRPEDPAALRDEVATQYKRFIRALLDVTDNIVDGEVVHPAGVRVRDGDDPYLVVAADKGTAAFSDTANELALERGFWLGDAFASGGSHGYDHKQLGITARGAWESVKRLFREHGQDPERDVITVAGVGDMSGDVFGNGMLLSRTLKLVAAYDHRHVFIDPDPDPSASWEERRRLFELPGSSWADYDGITEGGGVWPRSAKSIPLSPQARSVLEVEDEALTPDEVIRAILRAPVDLLFNGGIGTVVKASGETDADAHDRSSDAIRVDAAEVRARVVGEGGNLGWTQRARIEGAVRGIGVTADFIDNSAGVDSSDHEVNLKILLGHAGLPFEERNAVLQAATDDVVAHVLQDSYRQARILSREVVASGARIYAYEDLMNALEAEGILDRDTDALPTVAELGQRRRAGRGLLRPELAVLLAHAKRSLTDALLDSELVEDAWFERDLRAYFPPAVVERFGALIAEHRLRRELTATLIANEVVDALGPSFVSRLSTELGAPPAAVVRAYRIARDVTGAIGRFAAIDAIETDLDDAVELELLGGVERLVETVTRWYLRDGSTAPLREQVEAGHEGFDAIEDALEAALPERAEATIERLQQLGVPETLAQAHALAPDLAFAPDVLAVAAECGRELEDVGLAFGLLGDRLRFGWLEAELDDLPASQRVQRWAIQALRDDARAARRALVTAAFRSSPDASPRDAVHALVERNRARAEHLASVMRSLSVDGAELAGLMVVVRELRAVAGAGA
jgi:glutamate dehydrogenase